jgi:hypothetical protein
MEKEMKDAINYRIQITATVKEIEEKSEYVQLEPATKETKAVYGYGPPVKREVNKEIKLYDQTVDTLSLPRVIAVVNDLFVDTARAN